MTEEELQKKLKDREMAVMIHRSVEALLKGMAMFCISFILAHQGVLGIVGALSLNLMFVADFLAKWNMVKAQQDVKEYYATSNEK